MSTISVILGTPEWTSLPETSVQKAVLNKMTNDPSDISFVLEKMVSLSSRKAAKYLVISPAVGISVTDRHVSFSDADVVVDIDKFLNLEPLDTCLL